MNSISPVGPKPSANGTPDKARQPFDLKACLAEQSRRKPYFTIPAPELLNDDGEPVVVMVRHLSFADRAAIFARQAGPGTASEKLLHHLAVCLAGESGQPAFEDGDPLLLCLPAALGERVVVEALERSSASVADAKKA